MALFASLSRVRPEPPPRLAGVVFVNRLQDTKSFVNRKSTNTIHKVILWIMHDPQISQHLSSLSLIHQLAERQHSFALGPWRKHHGGINATLQQPVIA
jgi:hypothetical protein